MIRYSLLLFALFASQVGFTQSLDPIVRGSVAVDAGRSRAAVDVDRMAETFVTTISEVDVDSDQQGARIYADNDVRILRLPAALSARIADARAAARNGWEVRISARAVAGSDVFEITSFAIVSQANRLTDGFSQPDRNFRPLNLASNADAQNLFNSVYPYESDNYDVNDNCYNRAHYWSRMIQVGQEQNRSTLGTDKVFIFFTQAYTRKYNHRWWFHVAPMVYVNGNPVVLDPTFMDRAVSLSGWLGAFDHHTSGNCQQLNSIDEFYARNDEPVCFHIRASMFNYSPSDLRPAPRRLNNWRCYDFQRLMAGIPAPHSHSDRPGAQWSDRENRSLLPAMCR